MAGNRNVWRVLGALLLARRAVRGRGRPGASVGFSRRLNPPRMLTVLAALALTLVASPLLLVLGSFLRGV